jgi:hypothetical protein
LTYQKSDCEVPGIYPVAGDIILDLNEKFEENSASGKTMAGMGSFTKSKQGRRER